jgi:hypothetical protein
VGAGGRGGGIVFIGAAQITGLAIDASGQKGFAGDLGTGGCGYAQGGSGAGGTVYIAGANLTVRTIDARGGVRVLNGTSCGNDGQFRPYGGEGSDGRVRIDGTIAGAVNTTPAPFNP